MKNYFVWRRLVMKNLYGGDFCNEELFCMEEAL